MFYEHPEEEEENPYGGLDIPEEHSEYCDAEMGKAIAYLNQGETAVAHRHAVKALTVYWSYLPQGKDLNSEKISDIASHLLLELIATMGTGVDANIEKLERQFF